MSSASLSNANSNGNNLNGICSFHYPFQTNPEMYAKYRTKPPNNLIQTIIKCLEEKSVDLISTGSIIGTTTSNKNGSLAIDIGCGTGQVTNLLLPFFKKVIGVDISETQIKKAQEILQVTMLLNENDSNNNVEYRVSKAEDLSFIDDNSVQLITVCQALHWFNIPVFFTECKRILNPLDGILAIIGHKDPYYTFPQDSMKDIQLFKAFKNVLDEKWAEYWPRETDTVWEGYPDIDISFNKVTRFQEEFKLEFQVSLNIIRGFFYSISPYTHCSNIKGINVAQSYVEEYIQEVRDIINIEIGDDDLVFIAHFNYYLITAEK